MKVITTTLYEVFEHIDLCGRCDAIGKLLEIISPIIGDLSDIIYDNDYDKLDESFTLLVSVLTSIGDSLEEYCTKIIESELPDSSELLDLAEMSGTEMEIGLNIEEEVEEEPKEGKLINMFDYTDKGEQ